MLTPEQNETLTRVGPGTPMGQLLRRYWHPVAAAAELAKTATLEVRLLGEDLALFRDRGGRLGLLGRQCPHRKASLGYGIPEADGLRCPYHGWLFDGAGRCLEQPAEPPESTFADRIRHTAYPVEELGGLLFAYLGPEPAPLLPRYDVFAWGDSLRDVGLTDLPCNWLQTMENSVDPVHVEYLHGLYFNHVLSLQGREPKGVSGHHVRIGFDVFPYGIIKRRVLEGSTEDSPLWRHGHPLVFPNILRHGSAGRHSMQIRVPVDDTTTRLYWYTCYRPGAGVRVPLQERVPVYEVPYRHPDGRLIVDFTEAQDMMAWLTQGPLTDRTDEHLGASDKGVIVYRRLLMEQIERVERGEDPLAVVRDPAANGLIELPCEPEKFGTDPIGRSWRTFSPIADQVRALFASGAQSAVAG